MNASMETDGLKPPIYSSHQALFASISLHKTDRVRLLWFPEDDIQRLHDVVAASWSGGIQQTRQYAESFEIKLKGNPWGYNPAGNSEAKRLVRLLFEELYNMGWVFDISVRICKKPEEKDTFLFLRSQDSPRIPVPLSDWFTISCDSHNILTIQCGPADFNEMIRQRFALWTSKTTVDDSKIQIVLKGRPWASQGKDTMQVRVMLLTIRETLRILGLEVYAVVTMASGAGQGETDMLICNRS